MTPNTRWQCQEASFVVNFVRPSERWLDTADQLASISVIELHGNARRRMTMRGSVDKLNALRLLGVGRTRAGAPTGVVPDRAIRQHVHNFPARRDDLDALRWGRFSCA